MDAFRFISQGIRIHDAAKGGFSHAPCSNYRSILSSGSYYLEDFDYRSILVDSGIIVHWQVLRIQLDFNIFLHWMTMAADNDGAVVVTGACPPISRRSDRAGQSIYSVGFCRLPG